jgi:hypothetical protein
MNFYSGDKLNGSKTREDRRCRCGAQPKLAQKMLDPRRGTTIRVFQCQCGEQIWSEETE